MSPRCLSQKDPWCGSWRSSLALPHVSIGVPVVAFFSAIGGHRFNPFPSHSLASVGVPVLVVILVAFPVVVLVVVLVAVDVVGLVTADMADLAGVGIALLMTAVIHVFVL